MPRFDRLRRLAFNLAPRLALALAGVALLAAAGCISDGQTGERGLVRFSAVVNFADTSDLSAPLATGTTLLVALQSPQGLMDGPTLANLTLSVETPDGSTAGSVAPLGFAQYAVSIDDPGTYALVARDHGTEIDRLPITAANRAGLRLSQHLSVVTTAQGQSSTCVQATDVDTGLDGFVLHPNQSVTMYVVPTDASGNAMLGLLPLSATPAAGVSLDSPLIGQGVFANGLRVVPNGSLGDPVTVGIDEVDTGRHLDATIETSSQDAPIQCQ